MPQPYQKFGQITYINLTGRPAIIWKFGDQSRERVVQPSGLVAKLSFLEGDAGWPGTDIPHICTDVRRDSMGRPLVEHLPEPIDPTTVFIVTESVWDHFPDRKDLAFPCGPAYKGTQRLPAMRSLKTHPWQDVEKFFAELGHYTAGIPLVDPVKCQKPGCGKWCEFTDTRVVSDGRGITTWCPACRKGEEA